MVEAWKHEPGQKKEKKKKKKKKKRTGEGLWCPLVTFPFPAS